MTERITVTSTQNTLSKLGAHLRWQLEKSGISPEDDASCIIVVQSKAQRDLVIAGFSAAFDPLTMKRTAATPAQVVVHGVRIAVTVREPA